MMWPRVRLYKLARETYMSRILRSAAMLVATAAFAATAQAQTYSQTLPEFNGPSHDVGESYPFGPFTVGTFTGIPGGTIVSATIHGTFGNSQVANSAGSRVYLGSTLVAQCVAFTPCYLDQTPTPWAFAFNITNFSELAGPTATLTAWQDSQYVIRLGETTLDIVYSTVPEPASLALLATGLVALVPMMRKLKKQ